MNGGEGFKGPQEVWRNPTIEEVDDHLQKAIEEGRDILFSHEPDIRETHEAFVALGNCIIEAEEVREELRTLSKAVTRDQEEVNFTLRGAGQTLNVLNTAIANAKRERNLDTP